MGKLETFERSLSQYEESNRVTDTELATHLMMNAERFSTLHKCWQETGSNGSDGWIVACWVIAG